MSETEPIDLFGADEHRRAPRTNRQQIFIDYPSASGRASSEAFTPKTTFNRQELNSILSVYGRQVAVGEWRDYAIYHGRESAIFSIFRRSSEMPLYTVEKRPALARKQGLYSVVAVGGRILRRGHDLKQVLRIIDRSPRLVPV